jgi:DNA-directed RNA polymerase specialized sigma24 family protein
LDLPSDKIKAYLYGIARNKGLGYLRLLDKYVMTNYAQQILNNAASIREKEIIEIKIDAISKDIPQMSEASQKIITLYYEKHKSISEITEIMVHKNNETTQNMKYKSLQKLKKLVNSKFYIPFEYLERKLCVL